jgi:CubicO group peptidase (beta-lactamase class C family)
MKKYTSILAALLMVISIQVPLMSQQLSPEEQTRIDSLFTQWSQSDSPGASIAILKGGEVAYAQGYGMSNLEYNIPITSQSIFHVASVSKQFTDFAILLLEEEGKLSIQDDIRKHMPEIHDFGKTITIKHLMNHTSGFRDQWELLAIAGWRLDDVITRDHIMKMILGQRELNFDPGEEYMYCNAGYSILARIVEKVSGQPFAEFARERIFIPLGMNDTHVHDDHERIVPGRTYSYYNHETGFKKSVLSYANDGATSLFTTAEDLSRWMANMYEKKIGASFIDKMREPAILNNGDTTSYALGLGVGKYKGLSYAGHGGADAGFRSNIRWYPEHDLGIAVLSNLASFNAGAKVNQISDLLLDTLLMEEKAVAKKELEIISLSADELKKFQGKFTIAEFGVNFIITLEEDKLKVHQEWNGVDFFLTPYGKTSFFEAGNQDLTFDFQETDGSIEGIEVTQGGTTYSAAKQRESALSASDMNKYVGKYMNAETQAIYHIEIKDGSLVATHMRHSDIPLNHAEGHVFRGNTWWFGKTEFKSSSDGKITGFLMTGGRVRNLKFERIDW